MNGVIVPQYVLNLVKEARKAYEEKDANRCLEFITAAKLRYSGLEESKSNTMMLFEQIESLVMKELLKNG